MSPVPPPPQPSKAPPSLAQHQDTTTPASNSKPSKFPDPKLRLELRDLGHASTELFLQNFNSAKDFAELVKKVLRQLYTIDESEEEVSRPTPSHTDIPGTRSVTLILRDMDGVAYTTGIDLDDDHKEIHLSLSYLKHVARRSDSSRTEILGVVCHELVHCFQWNALGSAPGGLVEGIADWVRLNAGFVPPHWKREAGDNWDAGYQTTGYFLDWIEETRGKGSVFRINQALCDREYKEHEFWKGLFGEDVKGLWKEYAKSLREKSEGKIEGFGDPGLKMEVRVRKEDARDGASEETTEDGNDH